MQMPDEVTVGCHKYTVTRKPERGQNGGCDFDGLKLSVKKRMRRSKEQETLLHEVLHACTDVACKERDDEPFVNAVAPVLLQVIQDNPELVEYLRRK